jgi:hypothetical protein
MAVAARARALDLTPGRMARRYLDVYDGLLRGERGGDRAEEGACA